MTMQEIADRLYALCSKKQFERAQRELFASDAESIEPSHVSDARTVKGLDKIIEKGNRFQQLVDEMHDGWVEEPSIFGNYIAMQMGIDVTMKGQERMLMDELAIYEVKDGKIIKEQFFF